MAHGSPWLIAEEGSGLEGAGRLDIMEGQNR
jgi:hypothetical protein